MDGLFSDKRPAPQTLRPYQTAAVDAVMNAISPFGEGLTRVLYSAATGTGKTTVAAELVRRLLEFEPKSRILILAHRIEIIEQLYRRVKDHCGLASWQIGMEIAETHAGTDCRVIVGSVATVVNPARPNVAWRPNCIIVDECHHASSPSYRKIASRYGVDEGACFYIGTTATARRTDKASLYAEMPDGSPVMLTEKGKPPRPARHEDSVLQRLVFDYPPPQAMADGWLVDGKVYTVRTETGLDGVGTHGGDFKQKELQERVNNAQRTIKVINAWKNDGLDHLPTLVFCAGVEHAHDAAALWREAGYRAQPIDGETEKFTRHQILRDFAAGRLDVITNFGVVTEGTDLPNCACVVNLRPTKSKPLFIQMQGRGLRPLDGVLNGLEEASAEERLAAIAASRKPWCAIIDVVDLYKRFDDLCTATDVLDLPVTLDMQGHSMVEAKKLLEEFEEVKDRVIGECPVSFTELKARLEQVSAMIGSRSAFKSNWRATDTGYRFLGVPPGYSLNLLRNGDAYRLLVECGGERIIDKVGRKELDLQSYLDRARQMGVKAIAEHKQTAPKPQKELKSRGTLGRLTEEQTRVLVRNGHSRDAVDSMPYGMARNLIAKYMDAYRQRAEGAA